MYTTPRFSIALIVKLFLILAICGCSVVQKPLISIITDPEPGAPAFHGLSKITDALELRKIPFEKVNALELASGDLVLLTGLSDGQGSASKLLQEKNHSVPEVAEALTIYRTEWQQKPVWVVSGSDDRGLMYGLMDVADRIAWGKDDHAPLSEVREITEQADAPTRAVSIYTMNRAYWESRFYDEAYWSKYMDMLAQNRFNSLVVIFGYENGGFLAPCYPYFFDVEGFPDVRMEDVTSEKQQKNLAALNRLIAMAHERGLDLKIGIWDHIYRGGVQTGGIPAAELAEQTPASRSQVQGVTADNLRSYTQAALTELIRLTPGLDGIQFRMHNESGLKRGEMEGFWSEIFQMIKERAPGMKLDLRAKELPDEIIRHAIDAGVDFTITTKYWMEQMGLPFHPTHINRENQFERRHGYADMLRYPKVYNIHWRLWTGGTQRILLWGDPAYTRRFVQSTHLYEGDGFEVNEPLATKMEAQPQDAKPFELLNPSYRYYDYEFERYWHFFQVFGRIAYNPGTPSEVWNKEFEKRFGEKAGPLVKQALHRASWILPRIIASCAPYSTFPTTRGWPEKQRLGDLPHYASSEGSDIQLFASFDEEAELILTNGETAKTLPSATSHWFFQTAEEINRLIAEVEKLTAINQNRELYSTITDLKILSNLALYHAHRIPAAVSYRLFERTGDPSALDRAIEYESRAIAAWREIVAAAGDVYASDLMMGVRKAGHGGMEHHLTGHWRDELGYLENGLEKLNQQRSEIASGSEAKSAPGFRENETKKFEELFEVDHQAVTSAAVGEPVRISVKLSAPAGVKWVRLRFRAVNQHQDYQALPMDSEAESDLYHATIPPEHTDPQWDLMYFIEVMDNEGHGRMYPDFHSETPYIVVKLLR